MAQLSPILEAAAVHDRKMYGVWLAMSFSAGMVNATTLAACRRYVTHVTGTLTLIGADYARLHLLLDYVLVAVSFVLGAMLSFRLIDGRRVNDLEPWPAAPLFMVAGCLLLVVVLGLQGAFGPFGQTVETTGDFILLAILAFAMGLQNASVATTTGMIVRTTHMTGPLTDFSVALSAVLSNAPEAVRETAWESSVLRGSKIFAFVLGCAVAAILAPRAGYLTYLVPACIVSAAAWWLRAQIRLLVSDRSRYVVRDGPAAT